MMFNYITGEQKFNSPFKLNFFLLLFGVVFLSFRYTTSLLDPSVYAEDGLWAGMGLSDGWGHTLMHARPDYYVFFNVISLFFSTEISRLFTGNPLVILPESIALVSFTFYSLVSVMIFTVMKKIGGLLFALVVYMITLLIPLGSSQHEVIGRLLQIGFYMPQFSLCLFFFMMTEENKFKSFFYKVFIFLAAATNPVVVPLVVLFVLIELFFEEGRIKKLKERIPFLLCLIVFFVIILPKLGGQGGIKYGANLNNIVEMIFAREILYPFIFPWYGKLNDVISVLLTVVFIIYCSFGFIFAANKNSKKFILLCAGSLLTFLLATTVSRVGLTSLLNNYQTTFPDRYFMGVNILALVLFMTCTTQYIATKSTKILGMVVLVSISLMYILNLNLIIQSPGAKQVINPTNSYKKELCSATNLHNGKSEITIYPNTWKMTVPTKILDSLKCKP